MEEEEHEVYGGEIPEVEETDVPDPDIDMSAGDDDAVTVCFCFARLILYFVCIHLFDFCCFDFVGIRSLLR